MKAEDVYVKHVLALIIVAAALVTFSNTSWPAIPPSPIVNDQWPHYSADGTRIAFVSNRSGQRWPYVMLADGSALEKVPVTLQEGQQFGGVMWLSNDKLLFTVYQPIGFGGYGNGGEVDTFMSATMSGGDPQTIYTGINIERPAASPSGDSVVFEAEHGAFQSNPNIDLETLGLSTLTLRVLTHDNGTYVQAAWSPDGKVIAYACAAGTKPLQICTMSSDGASVHVLTSGSGSHQWPAWSPDSTRIAYFNETQIDGKTNSTIGVVGFDGSGEHAITSHSGVIRDETPSWSPDGGSIVFQTDRMGGGFRIATIKVDGSGLLMLTR